MYNHLHRWLEKLAGKRGEIKTNFTSSGPGVRIECYDVYFLSSPGKYICRTEFPKDKYSLMCTIGCVQIHAPINLFVEGNSVRRFVRDDVKTIPKVFGPDGVGWVLFAMEKL